MSTASATHTSFELQRDFAATPQAVFRAWADPAAKQRWSDCHGDNTVEYHLDFRVFGRETHMARTPEGITQQIEKVFFDIVPDSRIVFAYDIRVDARRLSVSLVTVEFQPGPQGTRMRYQEQLTYLDGHEDRAQRMHGTAEGLDRLRLEVEAPGAAH